jgi:hypothetical protein
MPYWYYVTLARESRNGYLPTKTTSNIGGENTS